MIVSSLAGIAVSALWYLTKEEISLKTIERIEQVLPAEEFEKLTAIKASLPSWVTLLITNYQQQMKNKNTNEKSKPSNKLFWLYGRFGEVPSELTGPARGPAPTEIVDSPDLLL